MRSSSCLPEGDWNSTKPPYWMNEGGLGLKTSARVPEEQKTFRFRFPSNPEKRKTKSFFLAASAFSQHRKFPPHSRNTSGTQGKEFPEQNVAFERHVFPLNKKRTKSKLHV